MGIEYIHYEILSFKFLIQRCHKIFRVSELLPVGGARLRWELVIRMPYNQSVISSKIDKGPDAVRLTSAD